VSSSSAKPNIAEFATGGTKIVRIETHASMTDGAMLHGYIYSNQSNPVASQKQTLPLPIPLLCLATELGNSREHHKFICALAAQPGAPKHIHTLDLRGRGRSDQAAVASTDIETDVDDLISYCDAHNLHGIDVVVSGYSGFVVFHAATKRPSLVRRLILNDSAPEFDDVGIARHQALMHRIGQPSNWEDCVDSLRLVKGEEFPEFSDEDWQAMARIVWQDIDGRPALELAKDLARYSNVVDYDSKQPSLWLQFYLFFQHPILLIVGEYSDLVTPNIVEKMRAQCRNLTVITGSGQGHVPQLERDELPEKILAFLRR